jgi:hypothetical protein
MNRSELQNNLDSHYLSLGSHITSSQRPFYVHPTTTEEDFERAKHFLESDIRVQKETVPNGLFFDPNSITSCQYAMVDSQVEIPFAVMHWIVSPLKEIKNTLKFFQLNEGGVSVQDVRALTDNQWPEFIVFPGWTNAVQKINEPDERMKIISDDRYRYGSVIQRSGGGIEFRRNGGVGARRIRCGKCSSRNAHY